MNYYPIADKKPIRMVIFQSLTQSELATLLEPVSRPRSRSIPEDQALLQAAKRARYRAKQLFHWVYRRMVTDWEQMTDLSKDLRVFLRGERRDPSPDRAPFEPGDGRHA